MNVQLHQNLLYLPNKFSLSQCCCKKVLDMSVAQLSETKKRRLGRLVGVEGGDKVGWLKELKSNTLRFVGAIFVN